MHRTENTDDDQADEDGGEGHPLGIPSQPPGSFVVSIIVAVLRLGDTKEESVTGRTGAFSGCLDETTLKKPLATAPLSVRLLRTQHSYPPPPEVFPRPPYVHQRTDFCLAHPQRDCVGGNACLSFAQYVSSQSHTCQAEGTEYIVVERKSTPGSSTGAVIAKSDPQPEPACHLFLHSSFGSKPH